MASASTGLATGIGTAPAILADVAGSGSAQHPYLVGDALRAGPDAMRNLADAVHCLCVLHGRQPGIVDHAAARVVDGPAAAWLADAVESFSAERSFLTRLASAAGPMPSTPGNQASEAALVSQRHALDVLARSERTGCALGAALALVSDWAAIRVVLEEAARRLGIAFGPFRLADPAALSAIAEQAAGSLAARRAMVFAAQQVAAQHRALWDLLEARTDARAAAL